MSQIQDVADLAVMDRRAAGDDTEARKALWGSALEVSGQIFSILSRLTHIMPVPMGAERNLCRLVPK